MDLVSKMYILGDCCQMGFLYFSSSISPPFDKKYKSKLRKIVQTLRLIFLVKSQSGATDTQTFSNKT